jgi:hypothetical protein
MFSFLKPKPRPAETAPSESPAQSAGWFSRLKDGLTKTRRQLGGRLVGLVGAGR